VIAAGQTLLHYRVLETLGEGGGGVVWRARDERLGREVALKVLPDALARDREALERFEREAQAVAALSHPNIVTVYAVEDAGESRLLSMEFVRGRTLDQLIPPDGLALETFLEFAIPLVDAVAAAHDHGVAHRDLKPRNIMVTNDGWLKVLDFGLARRSPLASGPTAVDTPTRTLDRPGQVFGTLAYMAPEQVHGRGADHRSDVFSLGVVLYEMATGRHPFAGGAPAEMVAALLRDSPTPLATLRPELPEELGRAVERCLEKDPRRRYQSALDLRNDLAEIQGRSSPSAAAAQASVAVLPFADMSREKDQEYLCDGIAEEILTALAKVRGLRVSARTSSFLYRSTALDTREIARRLGVAALLEGSVRKAGERLRIATQLVDAASGYHLWSERYDREMTDVFAIQEEIARNVADALQVTLSPGERNALGRPAARDVRAYDYYLRGRRYYFQYRRRSAEFALEMFERAIEIDPGYARAWAGVADCAAFLFLYVERSERNRARAESASRRALELDPELAEAHASRGVALSAAGDATQAQAAFESALRLDPGLFEAHYFYARHAFAQGDPEKAILLYEQAMAVRPEDYQAPLLVAQIYADLGRRNEAEATQRRGLKLAEEHLRFNPDDIRARYLAANALVALGERERGLDWARTALALDPDEAMLLYNVGCIYALAGEIEEAIEVLERAYAAGLTEKGWYQHDSNLDALREHPRFQALMRRLEG